MAYVCLLILWIYFLVSVRPLGFFHIAAVYLTAHFFSARLNSQLYGFGSHADTIILVGLFSVCIGHALHIRISKVPKLAPQPRAAVSPARLSFVCIIFFSFVFFHYYVGGIPLFSEDVLTARFASTSSGFFGIPGRFNLFGTVYLTFLCYAYFILKGRQYYPHFLFAISLLILSMLLKGSKGTLIHFMVCCLICASVYIDKQQRRSSGLRFRYVVALVPVIVGSFIYISEVHIQSGTRYTSVADIVLRRTFELSGRGYFNAVTTFVSQNGFGIGSNSLNDLSVFFSRLLGAEQDAFYVSEQVSAITTGSTLGVHYLVPQEINLFGYAYMEGSFILVIISGLMVGYLLRSVIHRSLLAIAPFQLASVLFLQFYLFLIIIKGNFVFLSVNIFISFIIFSIVSRMVLGRG